MASAVVDSSGSEPSIALVLGGGGGRGLAHLGILEVLEAEAIAIERICANSAGSIVGAAYLQADSAKACTEHILGFLDSPSFRRLKLSAPVSDEPEDAPNFLHRLLSGWRRQVAMQLMFRRPSLFHHRRLEAVIHGVVAEGQLENLRIPLDVLALDLVNGEPVVLDEGDLQMALLASSAVPGFFPPVEIEGRTLIDSGHADNLPVPTAIQRSERPVVAVNLSSRSFSAMQSASGIEIMLRAEEIGSHTNNLLRASLADVHICPSVGDTHWLDFTDPPAIVQAGRDAATAALPEIRAVLATPSRRGSTGPVGVRTGPA